MIVEDLTKFLESLSELKAGITQLSDKEDLGLCSGHVRAIVDFTAILASSIESVTQDKYRSYHEFEKYSDIPQDVLYSDISDLRELTNSLIVDFQTIYTAYVHELDNLNMIQFPKMIMYNLKEINNCLQKIE